MRVGDFKVFSWTEEDVEHVRKLLPKIANGRKTRYSKVKKAISPKKRSKAAVGNSRLPNPKPTGSARCD
jgi:hypothetical protein